MPHPHIVKRSKGHEEPYDGHKVQRTCERACLNAHIAKNEAEKICALVRKEIDLWVEDRERVSSSEIAVKVAQEMRKHNEDAAFLYETHRDIS